MWRVLNESLSSFCSSAFWDDNLTWNTPNPEFTTCFDYTVLTWFPCAFLWIFLPFEIYFLRRTNALNIPFNSYNISKLVMIAVLKIPTLIDATIYFVRTDQRETIFFYDPLLKFVTFCLFSVLTYANIKCGIRSSGILFLFSLLLTLCGAPRFYLKLRSLHALVTDSSNDTNQEFLINIVSYFIYYASVLVVFILNCFADARPIVHIRKNPSPTNDSSFLSKIFFIWFDKFAWRGYKNPITDDDIWELDYDLRTEYIVKKFESRWQNGLQKRRRKTGEEPEGIELSELLKNERKHNRTGRVSIFWPLCEVFGYDFLYGGVLVKLMYSSLFLYSPQILNLILAFVGKRNEYLWRGCFYTILLLIIVFSQRMFLIYHFHLVYRVGLQMRTVLVSLIYKKVMLMSNGARRSFTYGQIVNLASVDAQCFNMVVAYLSNIIFTPIEITVSIYWLWIILGPSILAGLAVLIFLTVLSSVIVSQVQKLQMKQMKLKDKRIQLTNEILSGIKVLKLYACEPSFEGRVASIRALEIKIMRRISYLLAISSFTWMCIPFLVSLATFGVYVLSDEGNVLDVQITFVSLALFNVLKLAIRGLPASITGILQATVALRRIDKFLNCEELELNAVSHHSRREPILIECGDFSWDDEDGPIILNNIHLKVQPGSLVAIVGSVGSGKSSLLAAILGEMYKKAGFVNTTGTIAYVPQQAWIQNVTLRDNITFGKPVEKPFYNTVLEACALMPDLDILPGGDQTEIGEKGINLSGGQRQRVSLARSVYLNADIYLLDDPLSAVDAHVGKHIFERVIGPHGLLKEKTRIFVTHNVTYLPQVDHIIVLRDGTISQSGTYNDLLNTGDFAHFLSTYLTDYDEKAEAERSEDILVDEGLHTAIECDIKRRRTRTLSVNERDKKGPIRAEHKLTEEEKLNVGNVKWKVWTFYLAAIGPLMVTLILLTNVVCQLFSVASDYWLSLWSGDVENRKHPDKQYYYLKVYSLFGVGQAISVMWQTTVLYLGVLKAAQYIHNRLLSGVLHWPSATFDKIPLGRIINRFSADVYILDDVLPTNLLQLLTYGGLVISVLCVISYSIPKFLCVLLPLCVIYIFMQRIYAVVSKQIQRLESASKSPIYSHFGDTILGAQSIRAYGMQTTFTKTFETKVDFNHRSYYVGTLLLRWFVIRLDFLSSIIVFSTALFGVLNKDTIGSALIGLTITYALQVTGFFFWWMRTSADMERNIVAVERIKEYCEIEGEAPWKVPSKDKEVPNDWPSRGEIIFKDLYVRYRKDLDPVLKGVSFEVNHGERVGIVGRTGAGKSSLTLSLFRIIESDSGCIFIDGIDVSKIGLHTLRSRLTIIPQDPVLFMGSLRFNLDPTEEYSDENLWRALELANLKAYVSSLEGGLQHTIDEGGSNFSVGQRQLICLARALLRKTRILVLDEATAAVDFETDDLIQATIRKEFTDCSVLTIAHRLNTVLDYDKIIVLDRGRVAELDSPGALLQSKQSLFHKMAVDAGLKC